MKKILRIAIPVAAALALCLVMVGCDGGGENAANGPEYIYHITGTTPPYEIEPSSVVSVDDETGAVTIDGSWQIGVGENSFNETWAGSYEVPQNVGTSMVFETTVHISGPVDSVNGEWWTERTTMQRFQIQATESGKGFYIWTCGYDNTTDRNVGDVMSSGPDLMSSQEKDKETDLIPDYLRNSYGWMHDQALGSGLQLRIVRTETLLTLYAYNGTAWEEIGSLPTEAEDATKIVLYGQAVVWTFSDITVTAV